MQYITGNKTRWVDTCKVFHCQFMFSKTFITFFFFIPWRHPNGNYTYVICISWEDIQSKRHMTKTRTQHTILWNMQSIPLSILNTFYFNAWSLILSGKMFSQIAYTFQCIFFSTLLNLYSACLYLSECICPDDSTILIFWQIFQMTLDLSSAHTCPRGKCQKNLPRKTFNPKDTWLTQIQPIAKLAEDNKYPSDELGMLILTTRQAWANVRLKHLQQIQKCFWKTPRRMHSNKYKYPRYRFSHSWNSLWNIETFEQNQKQSCACEANERMLSVKVDFPKPVSPCKRHGKEAFNPTDTWVNQI